METTQEKPSGEAAAARPVTPLWVIAVGVAILLLLGATAFLAKPRGKDLDAAETANALFASIAAPVPFGLSLGDARELPSKEIVLTYALGGTAASDGSPESLTIMEFPRSRAESVLEEQFQKLSFGGGSKFGGRGGRGGGGRGGGRGGPPGGGRGGGEDGGMSKKPKLQDAGFLDWHGFSANYARLRHTEPESKETYDTVRVNLSTAGRCIIGYVRFPNGADGSKERSEELLAAFEPRESPATATDASANSPLGSGQ